MTFKRIVPALLIAAAVMFAPRPGAVRAQDNTAQDAEEKWYQVEILVFERRGQGAIEAESWDTDPGRPPLEESIALIAPGESPMEGPGPHAFRILPAEALSMVNTRNHLDRSADLKPILHVGWRQPGVPRGEAQWVNLYLPPHEQSAGSAKSDFLGMAQRTGVQDPAETGEPALLPLEALQMPAVAPPVLDGTIRVHLARYLHADVDLVYHRYGVETPFRLATSRRMRSGELHYLDHPVFGVLIKVVPYEPEKIS